MGAHPIPVPPSERAALRKWAIEHEVLDRLGDSARVIDVALRAGRGNHLIRGLSSISPDFDRKGRENTLLIEDLVAPDGALPAVPAFDRKAAARADTAAYLAALARTYLASVAHLRAEILADRDDLSTRARAPAEPTLRALFLRLDATRERLAQGVARRPLGTYRPGTITLHESPTFLRAVEHPVLADPFGNVQVEIPLEQDPIVPRCSCSRPEGEVCDHQLVALDRVIDMLRDPAHPALPKLLQIFAVPPWERFLQAFGAQITQIAARADEEGLRLVYRLNVRAAPPRIELAIQKLGKRGAWSSGQRIQPTDLWHRKVGSDPRDVRMVALLRRAGSQTGYGLSEEQWETAARLLSGLIGHPLVFFENETDHPVEVRKSRMRLVFEEAQGGVQPALFLGERRCSPAEITRASGGFEHVILVDAERFVVHLAALDERARILVAALARHPATFPVESHDALLRQLEPLQQSLSIELPPSLEGEPIAADLRPILRIAPTVETGGAEVTIALRPAPTGPLFSPGEGPSVVLCTLAGKRVAAHRRLDEEAAQTMEIVRALPISVPIAMSHDEDDEGAGAWTFRVPHEEALLDLVAALRSLGDRVVVEWAEASRAITIEGAIPRSALSLRVRDKRDWFGVEGEAAVDGAEVPIAALLAAVRRGRRYVEVTPRRFARIEDDLRRRLAAAAEVIFEGRSGLELSLPGAALIAELADEAGQLDAVARFRELVARLDAARTLDPALPGDLQGALRPYQEDGFRWLARLAAWGLGGCLADDMGLGKTVQTLCLLLHRAALGPALVVAPTSVVANWAGEAARFAPSLRVLVYRGPGRNAVLASARPGDLLVTSYGLLTRDIEAFAEQRFATLVIDEAQAIKNAFTRRARAVRQIEADFRVALTGTPVENHLGELWSLMRVVAPGLFGSWDQFRERFAAPIERARDRARTEALARTLRPFVLRRTKAEVTPELPERTEIVRLVDLSAAERKLYDDARRAALLAISQGEGDARFIVLAALTRLRRLACHPRLVDERSPVPSSKLETLLDIVSELRETGHRALVFSQFTTHLALVREALDRAKVRYEELDGSTPAEQRQQRIAAFQAGSADLFLISLKAGGTGINLTAADYVIHLDPWWNPAVEDQATDRAHRIGQTRPVTVIRLVCRGTIEESVLALHGDKRSLAASVFDEGGSASGLSVEDLCALIREGAETGSGVGEDEAGDALGEEVVAEEVAAPSAPKKGRAAGKGKARA